MDASGELLFEFDDLSNEGIPVYPYDPDDDLANDGIPSDSNDDLANELYCERIIEYILSYRRMK